MKTRIFILCFVCFISIESTALRRTENATPVLHSIFDRDTPDKTASPGNYIGGEDGWSQRISSGPPRMPDYIRYARPSRDHIRRTGTGFMIAGGCTAFGGGALLLYANAEDARQRANGGRSYVLLPYLFGFMLCLVGAALALVGFPLWLTHLK